MILGNVNEELEAAISLDIEGRKGREQINALIDTGFSGFLTLTPLIVAALGLSWLGREEGVLADGTICLFDVYIATVLLNGKPCTVEVEVANNPPLIGMGLLHGHSLRVDVVSGGIVSIEALPAAN